MISTKAKKVKDMRTAAFVCAAEDHRIIRNAGYIPYGVIFKIEPRRYRRGFFCFIPSCGSAVIFLTGKSNSRPIKFEKFRSHYMKKTLGIIPVRYASARFPGKASPGYCREDIDPVR